MRYERTIAGSDQAKQWQGWGTSLKPAWEPIIVARKPLEGTVAKNAQRWGTGAINVDECRIEGTPRATGTVNPHAESGVHGIYGSDARTDRQQRYDVNLPKGRWPANVIVDEEAAAMLDEQGGNQHHGHWPKRGGSGGISTSGHSGYERDWEKSEWGGSSRFFYTAKASRSERGRGNIHPTVKPIALMEYLIKLVTRPQNIVLDSFCGSGSTLIAAQNLGRIGIGIDLTYQGLAAERIGGSLFGKIVNSAWS
jgi:site-specific DNA-methyltransferase (adenine-specific)